MKVILTYGLVLILNLFLLGCQKEEAFSAGWDEFIVDTVVDIDLQTPGDIILSTLTTDKIADEIVTLNHPDASWYFLSDARISSGSVVSVDLIELGAIKAFDIYAKIDGGEVLLAGLNDQSAGFGVFALEIYDVNLTDIASDTEVEIIARPEVADPDNQGTVRVEVKISGVFVVEGIK